MLKRGNTKWLCGIAMWVTVAANAQAPVRIDLAAPAPAARLAPSLLPPDAATCGYGFFCRQELQRDKALPVPLRFRVGSMQQADWLERKPNAQAPVR